MVTIGVGLSIALCLKWQSRLWLRTAAATLLATILVLLSARALAVSLRFRAPSQNTLAARSWLQENVNPDDGVVFEAGWAEYLHAHAVVPASPKKHWSFSRAFFEIETRTDPVLSEFDLETEGIYRILQLSAVRFSETSEARFVVTEPIDRPETIRDRPKLEIRHRRYPGHTLSLMETVDDKTCLLHVPGTTRPPVLLKKVFEDRQYHIRERGLEECGSLGIPQCEDAIGVNAVTRSVSVGHGRTVDFPLDSRGNVFPHCHSGRRFETPDDC